MPNATVVITSVNLSKQVVNVNEVFTISVNVSELVQESPIKRLPLKLGRKGVSM